MRIRLIVMSLFALSLLTLLSFLGQPTSAHAATIASLSDTPAWRHLSGTSQTALLRRQGKLISSTSSASALFLHPLDATGASDVPAVDLAGDAATTQSETSVAAFGSSVVAAYNDSKGNQITGYSVSLNGGATWTDDGVITPLPTGTSVTEAGDPAVTVDASGKFYVAQLAFVDGGEAVYLSKCHLSGAALACNTPLQVSDLANGLVTLNDKEYVTYDPLTNRVYVTWTFFSGSTTSLKLRWFDIGTSTLSSIVTLTPNYTDPAGVQGTNPVVNKAGIVFVFFLLESTSGAKSISYVTVNPGGPTVSGVQLLANVNSVAGTISCGGQQEEAFSTEAFSVTNAARVDEFPAAVLDGSGNIDITWESAPTPGGVSTVYVATLPGSLTGQRVIQALPNPSRLIQFQPWVTVAGTKLAVTYFQVVSTSSGNQIERVQINATANASPVFGAAFPISAQTWRADKTNPNFDSGIAPCYMGDYSASFGSGTAIYSVWGDNRNVTSVGPQPDVYAATH